MAARLGMLYTTNKRQQTMFDTLQSLSKTLQCPTAISITLFA